MGADTKIEWADHTANFWEGCTQISPACDNCYAKSRAERYGTVEWNGPPRKVAAGAKVVRAAQKMALHDWAMHEAAIDRFECKNDPPGRYPDPGLPPPPQFVFVNSLSDFFDNQADPAWRLEALREMEAAPNCIFLLLTKRIGNVVDMMHALQFPVMPKNVRLGITVVNQPEADRDIPKLLAVKAHLGIKWVFLSIEPMLGAVDLTRVQVRYDAFLNVLTGSTLMRGHGPLGITSPDVPRGGKVDWVICGGESGANARPMHPDWARVLRDSCVRAGVPFMMKQWGEWAEANPGPDHTLEIVETGGPNRTPKPGAYGSPLDKGDLLINWDGHTVSDFDSMLDEVKYRRMQRLGKSRAGRLLDGIEHNGRPAP